MSYASPWQSAPGRTATVEAAVPPPAAAIPTELADLRECVRLLPSDLRSHLELLVEDAIDQARLRGRVVALAKEGLSRLKLELEMARFDLDVTRRERDALQARLDALVG